MASGDTFPYKKLDPARYSDYAIDQRFQRLKKRQPTLESLDAPLTFKYLDGVGHEYLFPDETVLGKNIGKYPVLVQFPEDYLDLNEITDVFFEPIRIRCHRGSRRNPFETWQTKRKQVINFARKTMGGTGPHELREAIYRFRGTDECGTFRPALGVDIIRTFGLRRPIDPSAGWGDRVVAAAAAGISYVGCDPNEKLADGYREIIKRFAPKNRRYSITTSRFEDFEIPSFPFDSVITSPPYWNYEVYDPIQTVIWKTADDFRDKFLVPTITRATRAIVKGGRAFFAVNDTPSGAYMAETVRRVQEAGITFRGIIAYGEKKDDGSFRNPQPIFVFEH